MVRAIEQLRQAMEACELGALSLPEQIDALMDAGKAVLQEVSTLTPPNEPLTLDELRQMDEPVWVACKLIEGGNGYWCLCRYGYITTPGGAFFEVGEIPHWIFYRRPPEGEEDT